MRNISGNIERIFTAEFIGWTDPVNFEDFSREVEVSVKVYRNETGDYNRLSVQVREGNFVVEMEIPLPSSASNTVATVKDMIDSLVEYL